MFRDDKLRPSLLATPPQARIHVRRTVCWTRKRRPMCEVILGHQGAPRSLRAPARERKGHGARKKVQLYLESSLAEDLARASQSKAAQRCQLGSSKDVAAGRRELRFYPARQREKFPPFYVSIIFHLNSV